MSSIIRRIFDPVCLAGGACITGDMPSTGSALRRTLRLAMPAMADSVLTSIVGIVDTAMVGTLGSSAISAVGITGQPRMIFFAFFFALSITLTALVARRKGQEDQAAANRSLKQLLLIGVLLSLVLGAAGILSARPLLQLAGAKSDIIGMSTEYFQIIMGGFIFNVITLLINAAQRGAGKTGIALVTNAIANGVNVVFNYLLIGGKLGFPALGVRGAAIATVIGTACAAVVALISVCRRNGYLRLDFKRFRFERDVMHAIWSVGGGCFAEQIFIRIGFFVTTMFVADLGTTQFAAHHVGMNILSISFSFGDGLSSAASALVGQNLGAKRPELSLVYGRLCQRIGFICSALLCVLFLTSHRYLFMIFTDEKEILDLSAGILICAGITTYMQIAQVIYSGALRGAGDSRYIAMVSLISVACVRPTLTWILCYPLGFGVIGAWLALIADQTVRLTFTALRFKRGKWMTIRI